MTKSEWDWGTLLSWSVILVVVVYLGIMYYETHHHDSQQANADAYVGENVQNPERAGKAQQLKTALNEARWRRR